MRWSLSALVLLGLLVLVGGEAQAACGEGTCGWSFDPQISNPDELDDFHHDEGWAWSWACRYIMYADHEIIEGWMGAGALLCSIHQVKECNGDAKFVYQLDRQCCTPVEDIEAVGRCRFTAKVELNDREYARARGLLRHSCGQITSDYGEAGTSRPYECVAKGGLEMNENVQWSAEIKVPIPIRDQTLEIPVTVRGYSSDGDSKTFRGIDSGSGGKSPCTFLCDTNLHLKVKARDTGGFDAEHARAEIEDPANDLDVWLTCDGCCGVIRFRELIFVGY